MTHFEFALTHELRYAKLLTFIKLCQLEFFLAYPCSWLFRHCKRLETSETNSTQLGNFLFFNYGRKS